MVVFNDDVGNDCYTRLVERDRRAPSFVGLEEQAILYRYGLRLRPPTGNNVCFECRFCHHPVCLEDRRQGKFCCSAARHLKQIWNACNVQYPIRDLGFEVELLDLARRAVQAGLLQGYTIRPPTPSSCPDSKGKAISTSALSRHYRPCHYGSCAEKSATPTPHTSATATTTTCTMPTPTTGDPCVCAPSEPQPYSCTCKAGSPREVCPVHRGGVAARYAFPRRVTSDTFGAPCAKGFRVQRAPELYASPAPPAEPPCPCTEADFDALRSMLRKKEEAKKPCPCDKLDTGPLGAYNRHPPCPCGVVPGAVAKGLYRRPRTANSCRKGICKELGFDPVTGRKRKGGEGAWDRRAVGHGSIGMDGRRGWDGKPGWDGSRGSYGKGGRFGSVGSYGRRRSGSVVRDGKRRRSGSVVRDGKRRRSGSVVKYGRKKGDRSVGKDGRKKRGKGPGRKKRSESEDKDERPSIGKDGKVRSGSLWSGRGGWDGGGWPADKKKSKKGKKSDSGDDSDDGGKKKKKSKKKKKKKKRDDSDEGEREHDGEGDDECIDVAIPYRLSDDLFVGLGWTQIPVEEMDTTVATYASRPLENKYIWVNPWDLQLPGESRHLDKFYDDGLPFALFYIDGTMEVFYPDGEQAIVLIHTSRGPIMQVLSRSYESEDGKSIIPQKVIGIFDNNGNGVIYDDIFGDVRLHYTQEGGVLWDTPSGLPQRWRWPASNVFDALRSRRVGAGDLERGTAGKTMAARRKLRDVQRALRNREQKYPKPVKRPATTAAKDAVANILQGVGGGHPDDYRGSKVAARKIAKSAMGDVLGMLLSDPKTRSSSISQRSRRKKPKSRTSGKSSSTGASTLTSSTGSRFPRKGGHMSDGEEQEMEEDYLAVTPEMLHVSPPGDVFMPEPLEINQDRTDERQMEDERKLAQFLNKPVAPPKIIVLGMSEFLSFRLIDQENINLQMRPNNERRFLRIELGRSIEPGVVVRVEEVDPSLAQSQPPPIIKLIRKAAEEPLAQSLLGQEAVGEEEPSKHRRKATIRRSRKGSRKGSRKNSRKGSRKGSADDMSHSEKKGTGQKRSDIPGNKKGRKRSKGKDDGSPDDDSKRSSEGKKRKKRKTENSRKSRMDFKWKARDKEPAEKEETQSPSPSSSPQKTSPSSPKTSPQSSPQTSPTSPQSPKPRTAQRSPPKSPKKQKEPALDEEELPGEFSPEDTGPFIETGFVIPTEEEGEGTESGTGQGHPYERPPPPTPSGEPADDATLYQPQELGEVHPDTYGSQPKLHQPKGAPGAKQLDPSNQRPTAASSGANSEMPSSTEHTAAPSSTDQRAGNSSAPKSKPSSKVDPAENDKTKRPSQSKEKKISFEEEDKIGIEDIFPMLAKK